MMSNELRDRLESTFITRPFNIGFVPLKAWEELDDYCKQFYDNNRRVMILDLLDKAKSDWKYELLFADIESLTARVAELENKEVEPENKARKFRTFGSD